MKDYPDLASVNGAGNLLPASVQFVSRLLTTKLHFVICHL